MGKKLNKYSKEFFQSLYDNQSTYADYLNRLKKVATSIFEWENLPDSMNQRYLEETLFYYGMATLLKDDDYGFINTRCASNGQINIYGLPTQLNCFSFDFSRIRRLYTGLPKKEGEVDDECILVMNTWDRIPTLSTIELFAYRLYEAEMTAMTNIKAQKTPVLLIVDETQRLTMENMYSQYEGNRPVIFGDKQQLADGIIKSIKTDAPFIADKIMEYKRQIWNEALTFLGINTLTAEKKERMITDEASSNNELINMNLQSYLVPRQEACKQFNEKFGLTGTDKEIKVKVRSDLFNIIKQQFSTIAELIPESMKEEGESNDRETNNDLSL